MCFSKLDDLHQVLYFLCNLAPYLPSTLVSELFEGKETKQNKMKQNRRRREEEEKEEKKYMRGCGNEGVECL